MMYGWWDYGAAPPWYGMILGPIMMIIIVALIAIIIAGIWRAFSPEPQSGTSAKSSLDILNDRFARGEIDRAEYEERRHLLSGR